MCPMREIWSSSFILITLTSLVFQEGLYSLLDSLWVLIVKKLSDYFMVFLQVIREFSFLDSHLSNLYVAILLHQLLSLSLLLLSFNHNYQELTYHLKFSQTGMRCLNYNHNVYIAQQFHTHAHYKTQKYTS